MPYARALQLQRELQNKHIEGGFSSDGIVGHLLTLEHQACYTMGRTSSREFVTDGSLEVFTIERGGEVTFHGPGQLVGYFVANLDAPPLKRDLHWLLRQTEEVLIRSLASHCHVHAGRRQGRSGVWLGQQYKVAAVGFGVKRWVTCHGWSLNYSDECLGGFERIVPCGIPASEGQVGSLGLTDKEGLVGAICAAYQEVFALRVVQSLNPA